MWYRTGTISVTNGSTAVTGSGTAWIANAGIGEAIYGPDGRLYEIAAIISNTSITLASNYLGSTVTGQAYVIVPSQSYIRDLANQAAELINSYAETEATIGQGLFPDGSSSSPSVKFTTETNTGFYKSATNEVTYVSNGIAQFKYNLSGLTILTNFILPSATTPAQTAEGSVVWDSDSDLLTVGTGAGRKTMVDTDSTQTLTNKTLTSPNLSNPSISGTIAGASLTLTGNTTLGDAAGDVITINGAATFSNVNPTLSAGTANGVVYLNGSKVATTGSALTFDGTNLAVGNTSPSRKFEVTAAGDVYALVETTGTTGTVGYLFGDSASDSVGRIEYVHASDVMQFTTGGAEQMRLTSTGLGVGTSSPAEKLDVAGTVKASASGVIPFKANRTDSGTVAQIGFYRSGTLQSYIGNDASNNLYFYAGPGSNLTLDASSGNLGLGVTPSAWGSGYKAIQLGARGSLYAHSSVGATLLGENVYDDGSAKYIASAAASRYQMSAGVHYWYTAPSGTAGNTISFTQAMTLDASGRLALGTTSPTYSAEFQNTVSNDVLVRIKNTTSLEDTGLIIEGQNGGAREYRIGVNTIANTPDLTFSGPTGYQWFVGGSERMRIDSSGNLLVGTTSLVNNAKLSVVGGNTTTASVGGLSSPLTNFAGQLFYLKADTAGGTGWNIIQGNNSGGECFKVQGNGDVKNTNNSYGAISDISLKENIVDATPKLNDLLNVKIKNFNLKSDKSKTKQIGVIAQELEQVFPSMVEEDADGIKGVKYSVFVPILIKAIQEQQELINQLTARVAQLEGN